MHFSIVLAAQAAHSEASEAQPKIDEKEIVLGHMSDAYEWHITTWNGHHISIPLPVIVKGETSGWQMFSSARFHDSADGTYNGFYLNEEQNGKIYEHTAAGDVLHVGIKGVSLATRLQVDLSDWSKCLSCLSTTT